LDQKLLGIRPLVSRPLVIKLVVIRLLVIRLLAIRLIDGRGPTHNEATAAALTRWRPQSPSGGRMKALAGVKVVDFSKVLAGPLCAQYLGDLGAEVIKVETYKDGDDTRRWPPFRGNDGTVFLSCNRNKRSIALDLKSPAGQEIARKLVRRAWPSAWVSTTRRCAPRTRASSIAASRASAPRDRCAKARATT
jgi:hypothetical protein